jgi:hypothetical protein
MTFSAGRHVNQSFDHKEDDEIGTYGKLWSTSCLMRATARIEYLYVVSNLAYCMFNTFSFS